MAFFRTNSGIANQSIFTGHRFIVYVEEEPGLDPGRSIDRAFWYEFFYRVFKGTLFDIRGLGGKPNVLAMARRIVQHNIPNSLCALDRDYDDQFDELIVDSRVFYTFGYGAENDLFSFKAARHLVAATLPVGADREAHALAFWQSVQLTLAVEAHCLRSDQVAACRSRSTLDRGNPTAVLSLAAAPTLPLRFRREPIRAAIKAAKAFPVNRHRAVAVAVEATPRRTPAHLYFEVFYHTFVSYLRRLSVVKYNKESIKNIVISSMIGNFVGILDVEARRYYNGIGRRKLGRYSSTGQA